MKAWQVGGGVLAAGLVVFGVAWLVGRPAAAAPTQSADETAAGAIPPATGRTDVQAGLDFAAELVRTGRSVYERERDRAADAAAAARKSAGGSVPSGTET